MQYTQVSTLRSLRPHINSTPAIRDDILIKFTARPHHGRDSLKAGWVGTGAGGDVVKNRATAWMR